MGEIILIVLNTLTNEQGNNVYEDKKAIPFNNLWFLCKKEENRLREKVFKNLSKGNKNIVRIHCYEQYKKDIPKFKENNKENIKEVHFTKEVEEAERMKSKEEEEH